MPANIDVRQEQSRILSSRILNCLIEEGVLKPQVLDSGFDIYSFCGFNKEILDKKKNFYFRVSFLNQSNDVFRGEIFGGNPEFIQTCQLMGSNGKFAECYSRIINVQVVESFKVVNGRLRIFTGSNNLGGKI